MLQLCPEESQQQAKRRQSTTGPPTRSGNKQESRERRQRNEPQWLPCHRLFDNVRKQRGCLSIKTETRIESVLERQKDQHFGEMTERQTPGRLQKLHGSKHCFGRRFFFEAHLTGRLHNRGHRRRQKLR